MENLLADLKHASRLLRQSPGFTLTAIAVIALGIGANTAIFSVVNTVLLKPLPYPDADRIVTLLSSSPQGNFNTASVPKYNVWRQQTQVLEDVTAYDFGGPGVNLTGGDRPEQVKGIHVSHEFFRLFGVPVTLGRSFTEQEDRPKGGNVVVLSNGLWQRRFGADRNIAGKTLSLGGEPYTIIGVAGAGFSFETPVDLYLPFQADPNSVSQGHYFFSAARLKPGVGLKAAQDALLAAAKQFDQRFPGLLGPGGGFSAQRMADSTVANVRTALYILLSAVGFVLLIACANVANLQLARASVRSREIAIRAAIGAGRGRIMRQLLTESVLLSLAGGVIGIALGAIGVRALLAVNPGNIPRIGLDGSGVSLDWRVLAFSLGLSILTGVIFGLVPALQASRADLNLTLKENSSRSGSGLRQNKSRAVLVVAEMALAIVLLVGAGLLIRTFTALRNVNRGFDPHNVLTMNVSLTGSKYEHSAAVADMARQAIERVEALPGVQAAAATSYTPLQGGLGLPFIIEGRPLPGNSPVHGGAQWEYVTNHFFDVFRIPVIRGRVFTDRDVAGAPLVVVINEAFARKYWPKDNPLGQHLLIGAAIGPPFLDLPREIVGVIADARDNGLNFDPPPEMFIPLPQVREGIFGVNNRFLPLSWVIRTNVPPMTLSTPVQKEFQTLDDLPLGNVRTMEDVIARSTARDQFNTLVLGVFAFLAILLASIGLYGLMSYAVQQRTLEFGIRLALGANAGSLRNMIVGQSMLLALFGIVAGLGAAYGLTRYMASLLFNVKPNDLLVFGSVAGVLGLVALLASYLPAGRAVKVDPLIALRYQ